ncbi:MAG: hypothetical protein IV100_29445, partial [Myxococcales bacterium]|nr:hypothetical protein [Myxococcales bacterium]
LGGTAMEQVWQDWLTLRANASIWASGVPTEVMQPYAGWYDLEGLDSITVTANILYANGGPQLLLGTTTSPGGPFVPIADLTAAVTEPGSTSINVVISAGSVRLANQPPGSPIAFAAGRYLVWAVAPPASGAWELSFQLLTTPKGEVQASSMARDRFASREVQPYTSVRARNFDTGGGLSPRIVTQAPSMWLDTRGLTSLGLTLDVLRLDAGSLELQAAYSVDQIQWATVLSIPTQFTSDVERFFTVFLNRDNGAGVTNTLQNFLRWQLIGASGTSTILTGCFRISGGGSTR